MGSKWADTRKPPPVAHKLLSLLLCITLLGAFISCGGGSTPAENNQQSAQGGLAAVPPPSALREASYYPAGLVVSGRKYLSSPYSLHQNVSIVGTSALLSPDWSPDAPDFAHLAFAAYSFALSGYDREQQISLYWNQRAEPADLWLGLADWSADRWSWHSVPVTEPLEINTLELDFSSYINSYTGRLVVIVLATGTAPWELDHIQVGALTALSGHVFEADGLTPVPSADVVLAGPQDYSASTDEEGHWHVNGVLPGEYAASARKFGWSFEPASMQLTVEGLVQDVADFAGTTLPRYTASGYVKQSDETPLSSAYVEISPLEPAYDSIYASTGEGGTWSIDLPDGDYTADPIKADWVFTPETRDFTVAGAAVEVGEFTGEFHLKQLDGYIYLSDGETPVEGVRMWLTFGWDEYLDAYTDATGHYVFTDLSEADYTLIPRKYGYDFFPTGLQYYLDSDTTAEPFRAYLEPTYQLDGYVYLADGTTGAIDVPILVEDQMSQQTFETSTDFHGYWQVSGVAPSYYDVTPSKAGWEFDPDYRYVTVTDSDVTVGDFVRAN